MDDGQNLEFASHGSLQSEEAQQTEINILEAVMSGKMDFSTVKGQLESSDFYTEDHQKIFQAFENLLRKGEPIDILTVNNELKSVRRTNGWDWTQYVLSIQDYALPLGTKNLDHHIRKIKTFSLNRKLWKDAQKLTKAVENEDIDQMIKLIADISDFQIDNTRDEVVILADQKITPRTWLLEDAIPDCYPTIIYGAGGLGKSFLALNLAILTCIGGQKFLKKNLPPEPRNVLLVDYELEASEQARRAQQIAKGLNLKNVPSNLHYFEPKENLSKILPGLRRKIKSKEIGFIILDSLGASGTDGESVHDVVNLFTKLRDLGVATLILDHQSKTQMGERYDNKTPFGSVYKGNLARSVFQLSKNKDSKNNPVTLQLKHKKSNFGRLQDDLIFDMYFEGDRVLLTESTVKSDETKELEKVFEAIKELEDKGVKAIQKEITDVLKNEIGRDKVIKLLEDGKGKYWDLMPGNRTEKIYKTRNLENGYLSNQDSRFLKEDLKKYDVPDELLEDSPNLD